MPCLPVRSPGRLTTCQVVQVPGLVLARATLRSWLLFYVGTFSPTTDNSELPKSNRSTKDRHRFTGC